MSGAGTRARERWERGMQTIAVGATLARHQAWVVVRQRHFDCAVELTLRCGRRTHRVIVDICITGPVLWKAGLRAVAAAPSQRELLPKEPA